MNLDPYRQVTGGEMTAAERNGVLKALAGERGAFMRECRMTKVAQIPHRQSSFLAEIRTNDRALARHSRDARAIPATLLIEATGS
jgi:hypothetical protein